jgi:branched-chain amino acid transport system substrate-binding protein
MRKSAELAVEQVNQSGGINGKKLKLQIEDDKMEPKDAATIAQRLALDPKVLAIMGHFSSTTSLSAVPIYTTNKLVSVSPASTSPKLSGESPYFSAPVSLMNPMARR